jgi:hypothetical protein
MPFGKGKDITYASILSRIQVQIGMILTGNTVNVARDDKGADESVHPVTLLSPLSPSKKGANALYIGILSPCHPILKKS